MAIGYSVCRHGSDLPIISLLSYTTPSHVMSLEEEYIFPDSTFSITTRNKALLVVNNEMNIILFYENLTDGISSDIYLWLFND